MIPPNRRGPLQRWQLDHAMRGARGIGEMGLEKEALPSLLQDSRRHEEERSCQDLVSEEMRMQEHESDDLNTAERFLQNLASAPSRMERLDELFRTPLVEKFARAVAGIVAHIESHNGCLNSCVRDKAAGLEVCMNLIGAATEFEAGWNLLRLANIPGAQRQGRVGSEFVGVAILHALPLASLRDLRTKNLLTKALKEDQGATVASLLNPHTFMEDGRARSEPPKIRGSDAFDASLVAIEELKVLREEDVKQLRSYRRNVQHAASHASCVVTSYHFEAFDGKRGGAFYDPNRNPSYLAAADELIRLCEFWKRVLSLVTDFLTKDTV